MATLLSPIPRNPVNVESFDRALNAALISAGRWLSGWCKIEREIRRVSQRRALAEIVLMFRLQSRPAFSDNATNV